MLNIAIVGTGNISPAHIRGYLAFPERCRIAALVDIFPEKCEQKKALFGLDAAVYDSHKKLLDDNNIDLVDICTPPYCHAEIAIDALNYGKHVIVEKPMASSWEECDAMLEAAQRSGKLLSVIAQNRFTDSVMNLKKTVDSGLIGRILHAQIDSLWWRGHCYYDLWWRGLWEKESGGCTLNHAVHHIDMLGWIMDMPKHVTAVLSNAAHDNSEVEDISVAIMEYEGRALAQVTSSVIHHGEEQQIIFQGERARISSPWRVAASSSRANGFPEPNDVLRQEIEAFYAALPRLAHTGHEGQIDNVLNAAEQGSQPLSDGVQGRRTIELITAIYKSGILHQSVELPISKDDAFYATGGIINSAPRFYKKSASVKDLGDEEIAVGGGVMRE